MIQAVLVFNNFGKARLMKFYIDYSVSEQQDVLAKAFKIISKKSTDSCNFIEKSNCIGDGCKIMFKHFATLYFVFCCDETESELAILDLIQVFVEALDKCFTNVCELDLIFHVDRAHFVLNEIVMGGVVLDANIVNITSRYDEQMRLDTRENTVSNITSRFKDLKMADIGSTMREIGGIWNSKAQKVIHIGTKECFYIYSFIVL